MAIIIILNGPAGIGKDTIGNALAKDYNCFQISFKYPIFEISSAILGPEAFGKFISAYNDRNQKEVPHDFLGGKTCREFMIWVSETVVKPLLGNQHFGKLLSEKINRVNTKIANVNQPFVCTDGGFPDEVIKLVEDGHDVTLVRLFMDGKTFKGDSRDYIRIKESHFPDYKKYNEHDVHLVNGDIEGGVMAVADSCFLSRPPADEWSDDIPW